MITSLLLDFSNMQYMYSLSWDLELQHFVTINMGMMADSLIYNESRSWTLAFYCHKYGHDGWFFDLQWVEILNISILLPQIWAWWLILWFTMSLDLEHWHFIAINMGMMADSLIYNESRSWTLAFYCHNMGMMANSLIYNESRSWTLAFYCH